MNCEVFDLAPPLEVEVFEVREVLRILFHTICFHRTLGVVRPQDQDSELFDITYVTCGESGVERVIEERISDFCHWLDKDPRGTRECMVCLSFYEKKQKSAWFSKGEERLHWEQWRVQLAVWRPDPATVETSACGDRRATHHQALQKDVEDKVMQILKYVNEKKDHIPPVVTSGIVSFPFEISLPAESESYYGMDMLKRLMVNTRPPSVL